MLLFVGKKDGALCTGRIVTKLQKEGIKGSKSDVHTFVAKYRRIGSVFDRPRSGRPRIILSEGLDLINHLLITDNEVTTSELHYLLERAGFKASRSTVALNRKRLGWTSKATRYCQLVREVNRSKCVEFCKSLLEDGEEFNDITFTDEAIVQLNRYTRLSYHKKGEPRKCKPKPKHPLKSIYGCLLYTSPSPRDATLSRMPSSA